MKKAIIPTVCAAIIVGFLGSLSGQSSSTAVRKWQPAVLLEVKKHEGPLPANVNNSSAEHYDVKIRAKNTGAEYVLLYTPPPGRYGFQYMTAGRDALVLIEEKTVTFNDVMGRPVRVPIIQQTSPPPDQR